MVEIKSILIVGTLLGIAWACARESIRGGRNRVSGVSGFSVRYTSRPGLFGFLRNRHGQRRDEEVIGIDSITARFSDFTAIVGPPGSGKSTLIKGLHMRKERGLSTPNGGARSTGPDEGTLRVCAGDVICSGPYRSAYVNEFFYETYDSSRTVANICQSLISDEESALAAKYMSTVYRNAIESMDLPVNAQIRSLMETQKRCFEITLALMRLNSGADRGNEEETTEACWPPPVPLLLLLDEYFDKDNPAIVSKVVSKLKRCMDAAAESPTPFQVLVVSHSKTVAENADWVLAIHKGTLFHEQEPNSLRVPSQHVWR